MRSMTDCGHIHITNSWHVGFARQGNAIPERQPGIVGLRRRHAVWTCDRCSLSWESLKQALQSISKPCLIAHRKQERYRLRMRSAVGLPIYSQHLGPKCYVSTQAVELFFFVWIPIQLACWLFEIPCQFSIFLNPVRTHTSVKLHAKFRMMIRDGSKD